MSTCIAFPKAKLLTLPEEPTKRETIMAFLKTIKNRTF